jgi:glycosyltransferase involved in cell wall biosynthesis
MDSCIFAVIRAVFLNIWAGGIARLLLGARHFDALLYYSPQFAFIHAFVSRWDDIVWAYDKADAYSLFYEGAVRKAVEMLDRYSTNHAAIVLASSSQLENLAKRQGAKRTLLVGNGIYVQHFVPQAKRDRMLAVYVGNLTQEIWGLDTFLKAIPNISKEFPDFHVTVVGEGPLKVTYESTCRRLSIANRVKFMGYLPHDKIGDVTCVAGVAVAPYKAIPAFRFSSSLKVLEYLASGTPVVVSNFPGMADIVRERVGLAVDPTPEKIGDGICSILRLNDEKWQAMSKRAVGVASEYQWDEVLSKAFDAIEKTRASAKQHLD